MALVKCKECGKEISTLAPACPSCGAPRAVATDHSDRNATSVIVYKTASNAGVMTGILGSFFAVLGIFTFGLLFLPFAILFSIISLVRGVVCFNVAGMVMAIVSWTLTTVGLVSSPTVLVAALALIGMHFAAPGADRGREQTIDENTTSSGYEFFSQESFPGIIHAFEKQCEYGPTSPCDFQTNGGRYRATSVLLTPAGRHGVRIEDIGERSGSGGYPQFIAMKTGTEWRGVAQSLYAVPTKTVTNGYYDLSSGHIVYKWNGTRYVGQ